MELVELLFSGFALAGISWHSPSSPRRHGLRGQNGGGNSGSGSAINRLWILPCLALATPQLDTTYQGNELAMVQTMIGTAVWLSWVVNLLVAEWWLQYRGKRKRAVRKENA